MGVTETSIANSALAKLGAARIISLDDNTREALLLKEQFAKVRDDLLRSHPWNFAIKRAVLPALTTAPAYGFTYEYQVPSDCLRVLDINSNDYEWAREGNKILTDSNDLAIRYVSQVTAPGSWDSNFCEVLATKLALDNCFAITQSTTLKESLLKEYNQKLREARSFDGQESGPTRTYAKEWLNSRY